MSSRESKRKHKYDSGKSSKRKKKDSKLTIVDDDLMDDELWVEKKVEPIEQATGEIPTAKSLQLTSSAPVDDEPLPKLATETKLRRDDWMLEPADMAQRQSSLVYESLSEGHSGNPGVDFFSSLGAEVKKKPPPDKPDPSKPRISSREINPDLNPAQSLPTYPTSAAKPSKQTPGGPGSQWRMMRLRRVYDTAEEEGRPVEQVALERFGSLQAFEEAKEERRIMDERESRRSERERGRTTDRQGKYEGRGTGGGEKRFMFTDVGGSGGSSRSSSFRRPGGIANSAPTTPSPPSTHLPPDKRFDSLRLPSQVGSPLAQSHTPIPSVVTPPAASSSRRALSPSSLNKLQAKVLRAKLMGAANADTLEKEYEEESKRAHGVVEGGVRTKTEALPTLDGMGRLYDVGTGNNDANVTPGNRKQKEKFETRDHKTGELLRYNADDDTITLREMLRQEKFGGGMSDQKNLDAQFAKAIMSDGKFANDLDYMDDNAEKLGRQKMRSDAMKRQFAVHDYKRTQRVLATCQFCFGEDDSPPKAPVIAMGTRAYLSCTLTEELVPGHCLIVPIQHHLAMLEGDDDVWDEVRNFMKCLMRMFADDDKGVVFYETVITLKWQKHTCIECVPLPWEQFEDVPQYFKEAILQSEAEWSQHKKLIDFSRPGGFRRSMVPNLPYFMVQFDYKGEKGYGHVIEGALEAGEEDGLEEGEKGGGEFPRYFAAEIVGNILDVEPRRWRRPRKLEQRNNKERVAEYKKRYSRYDWTGMIGK